MHILLYPGGRAAVPGLQLGIEDKPFFEVSTAAERLMLESILLEHTGEAALR